MFKLTILERSILRRYISMFTLDSIAPYYGEYSMRKLQHSLNRLCDNGYLKKVKSISGESVYCITLKGSILSILV